MDWFNREAFLWSGKEIIEIGGTMPGDYVVCRGCGRLAHKETKRALEVVPIPVNDRKEMFWCEMCEMKPWETSPGPEG